ncbi:MAG: radical SAM protein [Promethearchaeia archaeon]
MTDNSLLRKFKTDNLSWVDFKKFFNLQSENLDPYLNLARKLTIKRFGHLLKIYIPGEKFPAISITGNECSLSCEHCNERYLENMHPVLNSKDLEDYLFSLSENGGVGALISGGCDPDGAVPLDIFFNAIKKVKRETDLIINVHTGLLNEYTALKLAESRVDVISFDVNMDPAIINNIYHLNKDISDYKCAMKILKKYKLNVVPHICIGLYYGELHKELEALKFIKESGINPSLIVLIALIPPTKSIDKFDTPDPKDIAKVIALTRFIFPNTEISLGCMRPRKKMKVSLEKYAIKAGITRIEIPSKKTLKWLKTKDPSIQYNFYSACCAIPKMYEDFTRTRI